MKYKLRVWNKYRREFIPEDAVYVGSRQWGGHSSPYRNPFVGKGGEMSAARKKWAFLMFERHVLPHLDCRDLKGKHLVCSCDTRKGHIYCHAELLLEKANAKGIYILERSQGEVRGVLPSLSNGSSMPQDDKRHPAMPLEAGHL